jgi:hypothetical protein
MCVAVKSTLTLKMKADQLKFFAHHWWYTDHAFWKLWTRELRSNPARLVLLMNMRSKLLRTKSHNGRR